MMSVGCMAGVTAVARVSTAVTSVAGMGVSPAAVPAVRESADCHCTEPNGASRQRDKVEIHGLNSTSWTVLG